MSDDGLVARCSRCERERPLFEFARDKRKASGRKPWCRECDNDRSLRYYYANRDVVLARNNAYAAERRSPRLCACGQPTWRSQSPYCKPCSDRAVERRLLRRRREGMSTEQLARARELERANVRSRPSSAQRGYGTAHQALRKQIAAVVDAGGAVCWRCGRPIVPGSPWDLGHDDHDRSVYRGPEHRVCNRGARKSRR
jgi:hypothetical protein